MKKNASYYIDDDLPDPKIVEPDADEFERRSWKSRKTVGYAILAINAFLKKEWKSARINGWPVRRTPSARRRAVVRAIELLGLQNAVDVKQRNGCIYLYRLREVA